jgi:hypothetical protein
LIADSYVPAQTHTASRSTSVERPDRSVHFRDALCS